MATPPQDEDPVQLPTDEKSGRVDYIEFDTPTELLVTLLRSLGGSVSVDKLCKVRVFSQSRLCIAV